MKLTNKSMFVFVGLALCGAMQAAPAARPADHFIKFKTMELTHKTDWFDHMKKAHDEKYDLLKRQTKEWVSYSNQNTRDWQNNADCSGNNKDAIFTNQLDRAIELHKKHNAQFKQLCEKMHKDALNIQKRHEDELAAFTAQCKKKR